MIVNPECQIVVSNNLLNDQSLDQMWDTLERIKQERRQLYNCVMFHEPLPCKGNLDLENLDLDNLEASEAI